MIYFFQGGQFSSNVVIIIFSELKFLENSETRNSPTIKHRICFTNF